MNTADIKILYIDDDTENADWEFCEYLLPICWNITEE